MRTGMSAEYTPTQALDVHAMPVIAVPARLTPMSWHSTGGKGGEETTIVIGGLLSVSIEVSRKGWRIEGSHGRHLEGPAASIGSAKEQALKALQRALNSGVIDVDTQLRLMG
jgi:hypothetical protein